MLTPPEVYVIFGGHLEIGFVAPRDVSLPNAFVLLHGSDASGSMVEVTSMGLPLSRHSGSLSVECGVIDFTGRCVCSSNCVLVFCMLKYGLVKHFTRDNIAMS